MPADNLMGCLAFCDARKAQGRVCCISSVFSADNGRREVGVAQAPRFTARGDELAPTWRMLMPLGGVVRWRR